MACIYMQSLLMDKIIESNADSWKHYSNYQTFCVWFKLCLDYAVLLKLEMYTNLQRTNSIMRAKEHHREVRDKI